MIARVRRAHGAFPAWVVEVVDNQDLHAKGSVF